MIRLLLWKTNFIESEFKFDQYAQIILNYIEAHPEKWDERADELILRALIDTFPVTMK